VDGSSGAACGDGLRPAAAGEGWPGCCPPGFRLLGALRRRYRGRGRPGEYCLLSWHPCCWHPCCWHPCCRGPVTGRAAGWRRTCCGPGRCRAARWPPPVAPGPRWRRPPRPGSRRRIAAARHPWPAWRRTGWSSWPWLPPRPVSHAGQHRPGGAGPGQAAAWARPARMGTARVASAWASAAAPVVLAW